MPGIKPGMTLIGFATYTVFKFGRSLRAVSFSIARRSAVLNFQLSMPALTSAPSRYG